MEKFVKFPMEEKSQIRVNKRYKSKNKELKNKKNDIPTILDDNRKDSLIKRIIYLDNFNKNNYLSYNSDNNELSYPLSTSQREMQYRKIDIMNSIYKNANKHNKNKSHYSLFSDNHYDKTKKIEEDNGNKLLIYKSETQYPLTYRKNNESMNVSNSMKNINYEPNKNYLNLRFCSISPKYGINYRTERDNFQKYRLDGYDENEYLDDNNVMYNYGNNNDNNEFLKRREFINIPSNMSFNDFGEYQQIRGQMGNNTNYYYNNNENFYVNNINNQNFIHYQNKMPNSGKNELFHVLKKNNMYNMNNNSIKLSYDLDDIKKDKELINIYKTKLINIFVKIMVNFYCEYFKKIYNELISRLRKNKNRIIDTNENENENNKKVKSGQKNKNNHNYYIKKRNAQINNNNKNNFQIFNNSNVNPFPCHKKYSSMSIYKNIDPNKYSHFENIIQKTYKTKLKKDNCDDQKKSLTKKSFSNIYIPAKNRNNNNNKQNLIKSSSKGSIFNKIKIDKKSKIIEINSNNIIHRNNSNNILKNNNYEKNVLFNSENSSDKQKPNLMLSRIQKTKTNNKLKELKQGNNNNTNQNGIFHKKILSLDKNNDNNNIYMKKTDRMNYNNKTKNNSNDAVIKVNNNKKFNHNFSSSFINKKVIRNKNRKNEEDLKMNNWYNTSSSINISNNINDYYLNDKPMNKMCLKNSYYDFEDESLITSGRGEGTSRMNTKGNKSLFLFKSKDDNIVEIENVIKYVSEDKKVFINFNSIRIDKYNNNNINKYNKKGNRKYNKFIISKIVSIEIKPVKKLQKERIINLFSNIKNNRYRENMEKSNMNLNTFMKKRRINNGLLKIKDIINSNIYETKSMFIKNLKRKKISLILRNIIEKITNKKLKTYFIKFKKLAKMKPIKKQLHVSFKEIIPIVEEYTTRDNTKKKKIKFEFLIDPVHNENNFISPKKINKLQGKEKLKFLVKQVYKNNNRNKKSYTDRHYSDDEKSSNNEQSLSEDEKRAQTNNEMTLLKSTESINRKNTYIKKNVNKNNKE